MSGTKNHYGSIFNRNIYHNANLSLISDFYSLYSILTTLYGPKGKSLGFCFLCPSTNSTNALSIFRHSHSSFLSTYCTGRRNNCFILSERNDKAFGSERKLDALYFLYHLFSYHVSPIKQEHILRVFPHTFHHTLRR